MTISLPLKKAWPKSTVILIGVLTFLTFVFPPAINAKTLGPVTGDFTVIFEGVDPETGELIFEGYRTGEIPGELSIRVVLARQTGVALHLLTSWTLTTPWGEAIRGENTAILSTASLHFREHGVIVDATGSLDELIGDFVVIHGQFSDLGFIPGVMQVDGTATYVPSQKFREKYTY